MPPALTRKEVRQLFIFDNIYYLIVFVKPKRSLLPYVAFTGFRNNYEEPHPDEGFSEIKNVHWVFEGTEEEKKYWSMWLQIDGK